MKSNTKLVIFIKTFYEKASKKLIVFKVYFTSSIFFLFFGFLAGNLFGSLLTIFSGSLIWQGLVTLLILMIVEAINYLLYHNKNRPIFFFLPFEDENHPNIKNTYFINLKNKFLFIFQNTKVKFSYIKNLVFGNYLNTIFSSWISRLKKILLTIYYKNPSKKNFYNKVTKKIFIKNINLFKIGILFGFFIDAFKVGS